MSFTRTTIAFSIAALIAFAPLNSLAADPPDVAMILSDMQQASGGDAWSKIRGLHIVTNSMSRGETVTNDHWEDLLGGRYEVSAVGIRGVTKSGFDGISTWEQRRSGIPYTLGDVDSALVAADESFRVSRAWWFRERHNATIAFLGARSENGRNFDVLGVTPEGGRAFEAWIDRATHLLARTDEQQAEDRVVTTYADYKAVDGVMIPFTIRTGDGSEGSFDEVETVRSVDVNPQTPETQYALPPIPPADIELPAGRSSVDVPFRLAANNRILVPVTLNDRLTLEAEFDSGGSLIVQPASVAKLGVASEGREKITGGGEGSTTATFGKLRSLTLGQARVSGLAFDSFVFQPDQPDEALIGLETLQRFVVHFDFDRMVMTLTRPDTFNYSGGGTIVPFHFQDNQPEVKGSIDGIAGLFAIDTGDNSSLLLIAPFARRYGLTARYHADIPYDGHAIATSHGVWARQRASTVTFDGADGRPIVAVHDPVTRISLQRSGFDANRNVSANIGLGILRQFNITFDYARQRMILEPSHFFGQPDIYDRTGLRLERDGSGWKVTAVIADSPASAAGLKAGDHITTIDSKTAKQVNEDELRTLLKGPVGQSVRLEVGTAPGTKYETLVLKDVI